MMRSLIQAGLEERVLRMVNEERRKAVRGRLVMDELLLNAARAHAADMAARGYLSHVSPEGGTVADRVAAAGYAYKVVGENIAWGQRSPRQVMTAWMCSRGHRANILFDEYTEIGIGVVDDRRGQLVWAQNFAVPAS